MLLVQAAAELLRSCRCSDGCPCCVHLAGCTCGNEDLDKAEGIAILLGRSFVQRRETGMRPRLRSAEPWETSTRTRLRHVVEDSLRERLKDREPLKVGDKADYSPYGAVVVLEIVGERARVQFEGSAATTWAPLAQLHRMRD